MTAPTQHIAVLGGSFDPVHLGHVGIAKAALTHLQLGTLLVMPTAQAPQKSTHSVSAEHRVAMLRSVLAGTDNVVVDTREVDSQGISYSVATMRELRAEFGEHSSISFIMGWDSLQNLQSWRDWRALLGLVNIAVVARPGYDELRSKEIAAEFSKRRVDANELRRYCFGKMAVLTMPGIDISSTRLRQSLSGEGLLGNDPALNGLNVLDLIPNSVLHYIKQHRLYGVRNG